MHIMRVIVILFPLLLASSFTDACLAAEVLTLAKDGNAKAVIVLPGGATSAARETGGILADHLKQICGGEFRVIVESDLKDASVKDQRIVTKSTEPVETFILLGEGGLTKLLGATSADLGPGGILIRTFPNAIVLLGPGKTAPSDPYGTRYAVMTFMEDSLGCRFLWPGELGKVVPQRKTIKVAPINFNYTPRIRQRRIRMAMGLGERKSHGVKRLGFTDADYHYFNKAAMVTTSRDGGWANWHRLGGSLRLASGHSFGYMWEKHKDEHPEWFAVQPDGTRDQSRSPDRSRLCVSNLELIEEIARDRIESLNKSDLNSVSIGPNDGGQTSFCRCDECRKLDPPNSRKLAGGGPALTDRYIYFWNEIAKRVTEVHPDAWLTADAYSVYSAPPVLRKLHPNIAIRFVGLTYTNEEKRRQDREDWDAWSKAVKKIYFRPNVLLAGRRQGTPVIYVHKLAEDFRYLASHSLVGTDFDSCCHNWATQGLNYYVCAKLHWNPDLDVDALIDDYCQSGFGSGADAVKSYFLRLEDITNTIAEQQLKITQPFPPAVIDELRGYLDMAAAATADEPDASKRVAFLRSGLEYTDAYVAAFRIFREHEAAGGGRLLKETKQRIREALDNNWLVSRGIFENHHLAVNVATVAWGSWNYFGRYYWSDPSPEIRAKVESR
ncbi:hypothetical protein CA13_58260 [Planctomycetes bacterium CA13]|uniref:Alpha glucuronidase N-terminal domain-containing protein n=1 Tax=Novipirellula herctigrandis TaxID=2527986 RepID=A0A5C5ZAF1_9BACT|nr:hypothetical protein CA13_58260 [Planctomycetes bacterium CA13]